MSHHFLNLHFRDIHIFSQLLCKRNICTEKIP
nr:MAG TPA: hypothetical protein [Bacteriophage sp.]